MLCDLCGERNPITNHCCCDPYNLPTVTPDSSARDRLRYIGKLVTGSLGSTGYPHAIRALLLAIQDVCATPLPPQAGKAERW